MVYDLLHVTIYFLKSIFMEFKLQYLIVFASYVYDIC